MGEKREFQAEVKQLLDLMVHSLYSNRDVFLRELISNASDAIDKRRFEQLTNPELAGGEPEIRLQAAERTLSISDNGIGMSRDEVVRNIGTIARSGTKEFLAAVRAAKKEELPPERTASRAERGEVQPRGEPSGLPAMIGQFGVGFYSAFMVADRVTLVTKKAGESTATKWESAGDGTYTLEDAEREPGTTVTLHLKEDEKDYAGEATLKEIVKRYSDFVAHPIKWKDETLNSMKAIWDRPKGEVSETEYKQFYHHISHDWADPLRTIPVKMEGTLEAYALLYLPAKAPFDLYSPEMKRGLQLYVKRVFVMDECRDLMPQYLRFVRGVVDAHDLALNVSREMLQKDRQIPVIRKQLVKKVLATLEEMKREKEYRDFWAELGPVLKEGLLGFDDQEKLLDLVLAPSTTGEMTLLSDYVSRMKEGQDAIYYLAGASPAKSPLLEAFAKKGLEVLLFSDPLDELWLERTQKYKDKPLKSIARGEVGSDEEKKQVEEKQRELGDLLACLRVHLQDEIKEVRLSARLTTSPACLVGGENDPSPRILRMLEQMGQKPPQVKRILELNPNHELVKKLETIFAANKADPRLELYAKLLLGQAHLTDSGVVPDPAAFSRLLTDVMVL